MAGQVLVLLSDCQLTDFGGRSSWVRSPGSTHLCQQPTAPLQGLLDVGGGRRELERREGPFKATGDRIQAALSSRYWGAGWVGELTVPRVCPPADLRAGGAVHRGHRGVGTADVTHAGDPGAALHLSGGLSVLRRCPAVRPGEELLTQSRLWPGPALWGSGADPVSQVVSRSIMGQINPQALCLLEILSSLGF